MSRHVAFAKILFALFTSRPARSPHLASLDQQHRADTSVIHAGFRRRRRCFAARGVQRGVSSGVDRVRRRRFRQTLEGIFHEDCDCSRGARRRPDGRHHRRRGSSLASWLAQRMASPPLLLVLGLAPSPHAVLPRVALVIGTFQQEGKSNESSDCVRFRAGSHRRVGHLGQRAHDPHRDRPSSSSRLPPLHVLGMASPSP